MLLLGAFGIAVFLVVLAGVLNAVAYTESLATDDAEVDGRDVAAFQEDVRRGVGGIVARANANDTATYDEKRDRVTQSAGNWSDAVGRQYASDATGTNVTVTRTTEGHRIAQDAGGDFTNANGTADWTLAENVSKTRAFRLNLTTSDLVNGSCASNACYTLVVADGSSEWSVSVNQSSVVVDGPPATSTGRCAHDGNLTVVDVTRGTVDGRECEPLSFADGVSTPYDIAYRNGAVASGTYQLVVGTATTDDGNYAADGSPSVSPAVYAAYVRVTYRTPELHYSTEIRVARGEPDE